MRLSINRLSQYCSADQSAILLNSLREVEEAARDLPRYNPDDRSRIKRWILDRRRRIGLVAAALLA